MSMIRQF